MTDEELVLVGKRINTIRINKGLTMEEFGHYFKTSKGTVNNWEKGRNLPNKENLKIIADLGGITVKELLYGDFKTFIANRLRYKINNNSVVMPVDEEDFSVLLDHIFSIAEADNYTYFHTEQIDNIIDDALKIFVKVNSGPDNLSDIINDYVHSLSDVQLYPIEQLSEETRDKYNSELHQIFKIIEKAISDIKSLEQ